MKKQIIRKNYDAKKMMNFDAITDYACACSVGCACNAGCACDCTPYAAGSVEPTARTKSTNAYALNSNEKAINSNQMKTSMAV